MFGRFIGLHVRGQRGTEERKKLFIFPLPPRMATPDSSKQNSLIWTEQGGSRSTQQRITYFVFKYQPSTTSLIGKKKRRRRKQPFDHPLFSSHPQCGLVIQRYGFNTIFYHVHPKTTHAHIFPCSARPPYTHILRETRHLRASRQKPASHDQYREKTGTYW